MPLTIPNELKKITPYVRRAEELDKDKSSPESRLVAYYCRQYAVQQGIPLSSKSAEAKMCLGSLLEDLEGEKAAMDNFSREEAAFLCRKFATSIFDRADGEDRMGMASKTTAKTFYAAANFLDILQQFYNDGDDSVERADDRKRIIYAKWKATEILKALKEGREPTPGGYGEEELESEEKDDEGDTPVVETVQEEDSPSALDLPPVPPMAPPTDPLPKFEPQEAYDPQSDDEIPLDMPPPPAYPGPPTDKPKVLAPPPKPPVSFDLPAPAPASEPKKSGGGMFGLIRNKGKPSKAQIADATELARFALAALEDRDVETASEHLKNALSSLGKL